MNSEQGDMGCESLWCICLMKPRYLWGSSPLTLLCSQPSQPREGPDEETPYAVNEKAQTTTKLNLLR